MQNYSLSDLEVRLTFMSPALPEYARCCKAFQRLQVLAKKPVLSQEELLPLAQKIRPIYRFNNSYLYWLTPAGERFPAHFGSMPIASEGLTQDFLGIDVRSIHAATLFHCYSLEPWQPMCFDLAEVFRQIPENINLSSWRAGAFELRIKPNMESMYDENLRLYDTSVILYKIIEDLPEPVRKQYPLPVAADWKPLL